jgi:branched-chain amino acid transport system substrate-binding protein
MKHLLHRPGRCAVAVVGAAALMTTSFAGVSAAASTKSTIVIGYITDLTGVASSTFADGAGGAQARIDAQNAAGGVNGHKLKLVVEDDQSSPTTNNTASQDLVENKGAFGVIQFSAFTFGGYKYLQAQGVPVTGAAFDGPEWGVQPNTNMFSYAALVDTPIGTPPTNYGATNTASVFKSLGASKVGGLAFGISESSQQSIRAVYAGGQAIGGVSQCYNNASVPFGGVDFTADVLQIKSSGCNGVVASFVDTSDIALAQALKNGGVSAKQIYFTGYDQQVLDSPTARAALSGTYEDAAINFSTPTAAVKKMIATVKKYDSAYTGGIMDLGLYGSYISADLMIKGLQMAGSNPTRSKFISKLRTLKAYTANGILPSPTPMSGFGTANIVPKTICAYFMQLKGNQFVPYKGGAICGKRIPVPGPT